MKLVDIGAGALAALLTGGGAWADTFVVTNTRDYNYYYPIVGSLRWAVERSNARVGPDTILFAIPPSDSGYNAEVGVWPIAVHQPPVGAPNGYKITDDGTVIDGFSQTRFIGGDPNPLGPEIELVGPASVGIRICDANDTTVRGLCIHHFDSAAMEVWTTQFNPDIVRNTVIAGCYLNLDPTGVSVGPGAFRSLMVSRARGVRVGGDRAEERNLMAGAGIDLQVDGSGDVEIINNHIGTDRTGTVGLGCDTFLISGSIGPHVVRDNVIGGALGSPLVFIIHTDPDSGMVTLLRNRVGVGLDGTPMGPTSFDCIVVDCMIGGGQPPGHLFRENIIAYAPWHAMYLCGDETDYVTISRNSVYECWRNGIQLANDNNNGAGVDSVDGVYGPGVNEEIDTPLCESIATSSAGEGGTTTAYFRCMADCVVEVFVGDPAYSQYCSESGYGSVHSGTTYLGDAEEIMVGEPWSIYRFTISPALPAGTFVTCTATNRNGSTSEFGCSCELPEMGASSGGCAPATHWMAAPAPNPCSRATVLRYRLAEPGRMRIAAYDAAGNLAATVVEGYQAEGIHAVEWRPESVGGMPLPGGLYVLRLTAGGFVGSRKVVIAR